MADVAGDFLSVIAENFSGTVAGACGEARVQSHSERARVGEVRSAMLRLVLYFTIVELLDATPENWVDLDNRMNLAGFQRTSRSRSGEFYTLPRGVYRSQCPYHASEVLDIARRAANATGCRNEAMTIESVRARWFPNSETEVVETA